MVKQIVGLPKTPKCHLAISLSVAQSGEIGWNVALLEGGVAGMGENPSNINDWIVFMAEWSI